MIFAKEGENTKRIFLAAFLVRLAMLVIIVLVGGEMAKGFVDSTIYYDDYRYELGAKRYAERAESIIDVDVFTDVYDALDDRTGHYLENPIDHSPLWYWIVCVLLYITKTYLSVRLLNILLAALAVVYVYRFARDLLGEKAARLAALLLMFLPYPVIFSCFGYKEQLVMATTFYLLYQAYHFRLTRSIPRVSILGIILAVITLTLIRGGLSSILYVLCLAIALQDVVRNFFKEKPGKLKLTIMIIAVLLVIALLIRTSGTIIYKLNFYLKHNEETVVGSNISIFTISSITQIYKLPFSYIFSMVMPIGLNVGWSSWYGVVAHLNVLMTPIAVGAGLYFFKKKNWFTYLVCLGYYLISIMTSLNIFRHYYSLIPLSLMFFSAYIADASKKKKIIVFSLAAVYSALLIGYYIFKG